MFLTEQEALVFAPIIGAIKNTFSLFPNKELSCLPSCSVLNKAFLHKNANKKHLSFVEQNERMLYFEQGYEQRVYQNGLIATRKNNWHDFFNAMVWCVYPKIKSAINAIHYQESQVQESTVRSRKRDLLTLFDESGVIVIANQNIVDSIRDHDWQSVFVENKLSWLNGEIQVITFGHALYEKYLNPYIGLTAHALFLNKKDLDIDSFLGDAILKNKILCTKAELSPLPLLGIPNWHNNQDDGFYANKKYFR